MSDAHVSAGSDDDDLRFDEVGRWTEIKLEIVEAYAAAYSRILAAQPYLKHAYIDGFAGAGLHFAKGSGDPIVGSPIRALEVRPPFLKYYFVDADPARARSLRQWTSDRPEVLVLEGDANAILPTKVFPRIEHKAYWRALCLLDPYAMNCGWDLLKAAAATGTIEVILHFPVCAINRGVLWGDPLPPDDPRCRKLDFVWGDDTWRSVAYQEEITLFGSVTEKKPGNEPIVQAYRKRLQEKAGFKHVPEPVAMRNGSGNTIYYLFFAGPNPTGAKIISHVMKKYGERQR